MNENASQIRMQYSDTDTFRRLASDHKEKLVSYYSIRIPENKRTNKFKLAVKTQSISDQMEGIGSNRDLNYRFGCEETKKR